MFMADQELKTKMLSFDWIFFVFVIGLDPVNVGGNAWEDFLRGKAYSSRSKCALSVNFSNVFMKFVLVNFVT
jgi:hypothetical protein